MVLQIAQPLEIKVGARAVFKDLAQSTAQAVAVAVDRAGIGVVVRIAVIDEVCAAIGVAPAAAHIVGIALQLGASLTRGIAAFVGLVAFVCHYIGFHAPVSPTHVGAQAGVKDGSRGCTGEVSARTFRDNAAGETAVYSWTGCWHVAGGGYGVVRVAGPVYRVAALFCNCCLELGQS